jgi:hypothetical protein
MSQSDDNVMSLTIDGRPLREWGAEEARQAARHKFAEGEALIAVAKAIEAAGRLRALLARLQERPT